MTVVAEFTIEPFVEGSPGPHVAAGLDAVRAAGFDPVIGPFGSSVTGSIEAVTEAVAGAAGGGHGRRRHPRVAPGVASRRPGQVLNAAGVAHPPSGRFR